MGDLQVDTSTLDALTHALTPVPQAVRLDRAFDDQPDGALRTAGAAE